ncbi:hypothetical protein VNO80_06890 [Phaseolus coccineus]|uniref:Uncharacterized protein n=1 Tax=Phaseolus coccineus TaxID=3886 RepID=A0AAN9NJ44_PHACN
MNSSTSSSSSSLSSSNSSSSSSSIEPIPVVVVKMAPTEEESVRGDDLGRAVDRSDPPNRSAPPRSLTGWTPRRVVVTNGLSFFIVDIMAEFPSSGDMLDAFKAKGLQRKGMTNIETVPSDAASGVTPAKMTKHPSCGLSCACSAQASACSLSCSALASCWISSCSCLYCSLASWRVLIVRT